MPNPAQATEQSRSTPANSKVTPADFTKFGELLRFLRRQAGLTQLQLSLAVGYSESQISRLEKNARTPDRATLAARFVPALQLNPEREWAARLLELAATSRREDETKTHERETRTPLHNLPIQLTSFVGREKELAEIKSSLASKPPAQSVRLLTLTGPGGAGKTRLALQAASNLFDAYPDGIWLVELAPLADPALVPHAVAAVLGAREPPGQPMLHSLVDHLRSKNMLLVLDNCEHVIDACARLADALLRACPNVSILATSREALNIAGETAWTVPSLSLPDVRQQRLTVAVLSQYEAVQLFVDRARAVQPSFKLTELNSSAVAQVCQRLDGMPLAIELAAARAKVLKTAEIAARLDDRFSMLTAGTRTSLPRQQTLRAAIDWSYDLLTEPERVLLRRLSVFAGGCTLDAAEAVCSMHAERGESSNEVAWAPAFRLPRSEILDLLAHLVAKSLVVVDKQSGETRYHMLDTIRQYARERLFESGEGKAVRNRHLEFFVKLAEEGEVKIRSAERPAWTNRLEREQDNLRAGLEWSLESEAEKGLRMVGAMVRFWLVRGYFTEGRDWAIRILPHSDNAPAALRSKALYAAGFLAVWQSDLETAHTLLEQSATLSEEVGDKQGLAAALGGLSFESLWRGDLDKAANLIEQRGALCREIGDTWNLAEELHSQSSIVLRRGDYAKARALSEESLMLFSQTGDKWGKASPLFALAQIAYRQSEYATARQLCQESLALWREAGDTNGCALATNALGEISRAMGEYAQAAAYYQESSALAPFGGDVALAPKRGGIASQRANLGFAVLHLQGDAQALGLFREGLLIAQKSDDQYNTAICLIGFAGVALARRQSERAARLLGASSAFLESSGVQLEPADQIEYESMLAAVRAQTDEESFGKAWAEGRALILGQGSGQAQSLSKGQALEQTIEYALEPTTPSEEAAQPRTLRQTAKQEFGGLTERERQVAALIAQGASNREIAEALVVSERTVETHVANILNKFGFTSRAQIRKWVREKRLGKRDE